MGLLGEGGSATVYRARWGHRAVALKVVRDQLVDSERARFLDEARLLMEMSHPGVVKVLSVGTLPDQRPYLVMEQLPGLTLAERLVDGPIPIAKATALFTQLCDAVAAMHQAGLVHRDLKPENVMLVEGAGTWHAVLLDFGIAKSMGEAASLTQTGQVRGTPAYMAPERFFGTPASVATDIYELTVIYFAMVAGRLPWADSADPDVRLNPARLSELAEVPPALDEEVARALSTRAANRPRDVATLRARIVAGAAAEMAGALRITARDNPPAASFLPASASAPTRSGKAGPQPWREPGGAVTTGAAAAGERAKATAATPARRRWPLAAALVGAAAVGGLAVAALKGRSNGAPVAATNPGRPDPWTAPATEADGGSDAPAVEVELSAERRDALRGKLSAALLHHAATSTAAIGLSVAELRADEHFAQLLGRNSLMVGSIRTLLLGSCDLPIAAEADWLTLAVVERPGSLRDYELAVSGPWPRERVEACLSTADAGPAQRVGGDGEPVSELTTADGVRRVVWLDERTFLVATYPLAADDALGRARPRIADPSPLDQIGTRVDRHATAWMVGTAATVAGVVDDQALAHAFALRIGVDDDGLAGVLSLFPPDRRSAERALASLRRLLGELQTNPLLSKAFPDLAIEIDGDTVRLRGRLPARFSQVVADQLAGGLP